MECDGCLPDSLYCDMVANPNGPGHGEKTDAG
jgi:hypothetical protein